MKIKDILNDKPAIGASGAVTIGQEAPVRELLDALAEHNIGAIMVSDDGARLTGIVSERDVVRRLREDADLLAKPVSAIMTAAVHTCAPGDTVDSLMSVMTQHRVRHIPVIDNDAIVGVVSIGDVVKHKINELEFERDQLHSYVHQS